MGVKISVVMASYLGEYPHAAKNRDAKIKRAIQSFLNQSYDNKELVIVSDGCDLTSKLVYEFAGREYDLQPLVLQPNVHFEEFIPVAKNISLVRIHKQEHFSGRVRSVGIKYSSGEAICYLDTDDTLFGSHLSDIAGAFEVGPYDYRTFDWVYYNDYVAINDGLQEKRMRGNALEYGRIGTSSIAHRKRINITWPDGYGHDWYLVKEMMERFPDHKQIRTEGYLVCHIPTQIDV